MLHITKLAVGVRDAAHLAELQQARLADPPLRHITRNLPRRRGEIVDGGSIYWVIGGFVRVRQRVLDITETRRDDGTPATAIVLDPKLVAVRLRPARAFQGWRYLPADDAPPDVAGNPALDGSRDLPPGLAAKLGELGLL